jgi:hypothetical protein
VLVSDYNRADPAFFFASSHPDDKGVLTQVVQQNKEAHLAGISVAGIGASTFKVTGSEWNNWNNFVPRGLLKLNYGYSDGSVQRFDDVRTHVAGDGDDRFHAAPIHADSSIAATSAKRYLPGN